MTKPLPAPDIEDFAQEIADFVFAGGSMSAVYGLDAKDLEAIYALAYNLYNQARWQEALQTFSFLTYQSHLERRFHVGRGACLQMLGRHDDALRAYLLAHVLDVSEPTVALHIAECLIALHRKDDARTALETVVALTEEDVAFAPIRSRAQALASLVQQ